MFDQKFHKSSMFVFLVRGFLVFAFLSLMFIALTYSFFKFKMTNNFRLVSETKSLARDIPVYKYKSLKTGLNVVIAKVDGPLVQGFFTIATEAHDDDGLPHTLEHLIFLGSEDYPYKGVLDLLANRCLAEGTNAWTDVDHTAYTVATAGSDGFLNLLPIYLNHLLFPTLTDSAFTTEVYHINGKGEDAGVVYSEMQAIENTGPHLTLEAAIRALYPEPSGYHYETGGKMSNLRDSITNKKIRDYHEALYRPENLHVIITGQIDPEEVFQALKPIEKKIMSKDKRNEFSKPWQSSLPQFNETKDIKVVYPSDTEDTGIVHVGWRGPSVVNDISEFQSMVVLLKYLTHSSVSPLPKAFIEVEDPYASEIDNEMLRNSVSSCILSFFGVPMNKIENVNPLLLEILNNLANGTTPFDLEMMRDMLNNLILKEERNLETSPHPTLADMIITDLLYGESDEYLDKVINKIIWYKKLLSEPSSYWISLLGKYLTSSPSVIVRGFPSIEKAKQLREEEKQRFAKRTAELGSEGLNHLADNVKKAKKTNEIPAPDWLLESVPLPSVEKINFHPIEVYTNIKNHHSGNISSLEPNLSLDLNTFPIKVQLDDVKSNFVEIVAVLDTTTLSHDERLYLPLLEELLLESSIIKGGKVIPHETVIKSWNADTLLLEPINGLTLRSSTFSFGQYFHLMGLHLQVEMTKYEKGVQWLNDILFNVVFDPERVNVKASKLLNSIGDKKRDGYVILNLMLADVAFKNDTNINAVNPLRQEKFLNNVIKELKNDSAKILQDLKKVYKKITYLDNITIHMATDLKKLASKTSILEPWSNIFPNDSEPVSMELNVVSDWDETAPFVESDAITGYIAGVGSIESAYMFQTTPAIANYSHPDLPILMTVISYLTQLEGPMWKQIRGKGLSYSYLIRIKPNEGLLSLMLGKAAQLTEAYKEAVEIINTHLNDTAAWNRLLFESARSSLIYEIINREAEISDVVQQSLYAYYRKVPHDYHRVFLQALKQVKLEDLHRIANKYLKQLIDPKLSRTVVVCPTSKAKEVETHFSKMGHNLEVVETLEESRFAELHK